MLRVNLDRRRSVSSGTFPRRLEATTYARAQTPRLPSQGLPDLLLPAGGRMAGAEDVMSSSYVLVCVCSATGALGALGVIFEGAIFNFAITFW